MVNVTVVKFPTSGTQRGSSIMSLRRALCDELYVKEGYCTTVQYVPLSHRWDNADVPKFKVQNLESMAEEGVPVYTLRKTFQEAFRVAR